jgi:membrane-bound lytic murein transglycosylase D
MTTLLAIYFESAILLAVGGLALAALVRWGGGLLHPAPRRWLTAAYVLLALALILPWSWRLSGARAPHAAAVEVWSGPRPPLGTAANPIAFSWPAPARPLAVPGLRLQREALTGLAALIAVGGLFAGWHLLRARRRLMNLCRSLPTIKRHGRVRLCAADRAPAPYAARAGAEAFIVVPTDLVADGTRLRLVVDHEAEHLRRGDLLAAGLIGVLRLLYYWNPALALWERAVAELQDLACDRRVLQRRRISALDYSRCLLWAAEAAGGSRYLLPGVRAMAASSAPSLRRRILMLTRTAAPLSGWRRLRGIAVGLLAGALLLTTSWVVHGSVAERKLSQGELTALSARLQTRSGFPLLVDEKIAAAVNRRIGTPEARELTRRALQRMRNYRAMIEDVLSRRGLPRELLAMVMAESGFDNEARPNRPPEVQAAGIWQIIPGSARRLGLQVSPTLDERLEPRRATEAAAAYLMDLHRKFGDWPLAIAAYNGGASAVEKLATGVPITEARARVLSSDTEFGRYLPGVMASIVLIENPTLAD